MIKIYQKTTKQNISGKSVVDLMTDSSQRSSLWQKYHNALMDREDELLIGINYADRIGDASPCLRGFEFNNSLYEIDFNAKKIKVQPSFGMLFYDADKIESKREYVFEGTIEDILKEFESAGYSLIKSS